MYLWCKSVRRDHACMQEMPFYTHVRSVACAGKEMEGFKFCPPIVFVYSCYYVVIIESMLACCVCLVTLESFFHSMPFPSHFY